jgi:hypothetical protein
MKMGASPVLVSGQVRMAPILAHLAKRVKRETHAIGREDRGLTILLAVGYPDDMFVVSYRMFQVFHSLTRVSPHTLNDVRPPEPGITILGRRGSA